MCSVHVADVIGICYRNEVNSNWLVVRGFLFAIEQSTCALKSLVVSGGFFCVFMSCRVSSLHYEVVVAEARGTPFHTHTHTRWPLDGTNADGGTLIWCALRDRTKHRRLVDLQSFGHRVRNPFIDETCECATKTIVFCVFHVVMRWLE